MRDVHQSGRFDATTARRLAVGGVIEDAASVGLLTEGIGFALVPGWVSSGRETKVLWRESSWEMKEHGVESIPTPPWKRGTANRTSVEVEWALLRHKKRGLRLFRGGGHLPAHLFRPSQRTANQAALNGLKAALWPIVERLEPDQVTLSFDFNRDLRFARQRRIVQRSVRDTGLHLVVPPEGTRLLRKIDGFLTTGTSRESTMLDRSAGFDHRGVRLRSHARSEPQPP
jgi:hypothetical protein